MRFKLKNNHIYDEHFDCIICPEYQVLSYRTTNRDGSGNKGLKQNSGTFGRTMKCWRMTPGIRRNKMRSVPDASRPLKGSLPT